MKHNDNHIIYQKENKCRISNRTGHVNRMPHNIRLQMLRNFTPKGQKKSRKTFEEPDKQLKMGQKGSELVSLSLCAAIC